jgi:hypothetical protein
MLKIQEKFNYRQKRKRDEEISTVSPQMQLIDGAHRPDRPAA